MSTPKENQNLQLSLNILCKELNYILHLTEISVVEELEKYNQVVQVCKPWPSKQNKSTRDSSSLVCTCTQSNVQEEESESNKNDNLLFEDIPKILNKTKALRTNPTKNTIRHFMETKKSIDSILHKTELKKSNCDKDNIRSIKCKQSTSKSSVTTITSSRSKDLSLKSKESIHNPSCALYKVEELKEKRSFSSLSEAVTTYGIPTSLSKILNQYQEYIVNSEKLDRAVTKHAKDVFVRGLEKQNDKNWNVVQTKVEKLPKYMLALKSKEINISTVDSLPCFIYHNWEDLKKYQMHKIQVKRREIWNTILKTIIQNLLPEISNTDLSDKEKIYIYKTIKIICNYSRSPVSNIPVLRLN